VQRALAVRIFLIDAYFPVGEVTWRKIHSGVVLPSTPIEEPL
jgi:hypothetical protein